MLLEAFILKINKEGGSDFRQDTDRTYQFLSYTNKL